MRLNKWTLGLAAVGVVSLNSVTQAEEAQHAVMTAVQSTTLSGYVDTSAIWLAGPSELTASRNFFNTVGPVAFSFDNDPRNADAYSPQTVYGRSYDQDDKQNGFNLNVVNLAIEKPLDEGQWSAGYKASVWLGPDANTLGSLSALAVGSGDFAIRNAYVSLRAPVGNGIDFKFGVFDTVIGYETADSPFNPNYSRSFGFFIEPIIHTGMLASYQVNDILSIQGGIAETGNNSINGRSGVRGVKTYMGSLALTAPESMGWLEGATLYGGIVDIGIGESKFVFLNGMNAAPTPLITQDLINFYAGATMPLPLEGWAVGIAYDYRANGVYDSSYENSIGAYMSWQASEKFTLNGRFEYATGSSGSGVFGTIPGSTTTLANASNFGAFDVPGGSGAHNVKMTGVTATADYNLWGPAITRLEFRWDHAANGQRIFQASSRKNVYSIALNVIYQF